MSRAGFIQEFNLDSKLALYQEAKNEEKIYKEKSSNLNTEIKDYMMQNIFADENGNRLFEGSTYNATLTVTEKESLDEDKAIEILKDKLSEEDFAKCVRTKQYIDDDALEKIVYSSGFDMQELNSCVVKSKPTYTLRVSKRKKKKEEK